MWKIKPKIPIFIDGEEKSYGLPGIGKDKLEHRLEGSSDTHLIRRFCSFTL